MDHLILSELFTLWRNPDPQALVPAALAACDVHTQRCHWRRGYLFEFTQGMFTRFPAEILLLFKLRQMIGLDNPKVDHPLMNTSLGVLPAAVPFDAIATPPDDLTYQVRARMLQDGYDENAIFEKGRTP